MSGETRVLVASQNQVKADAAAEAFERYCGGNIIVELAECEIRSGVSDQPMSLEETALGALNRLYAVKRYRGYDFHVAIEGGVYSVDLPIGTQWFASACAAVRRQPPGSDVEIGYGPAYPVPRHLVKHLRNGLDLNQAMELETGIHKIGSSIGFNGWLTNGVCDRKAGSSQAVIMALAGLLKS